MPLYKLFLIVGLKNIESTLAKPKKQLVFCLSFEQYKKILNKNLLSSRKLEENFFIGNED
jgi:hypothetical protein